MAVHGGDDERSIFDHIPLAAYELAGQGTHLLTAAERDAIAAYALGGYERVNAAMRGLIPMTPALSRRISTIRSGLRRYPLPTTVRVTRETDAYLYGIADAQSARTLIDQEFAEPGFLSTSGTVEPPHSMRRPDPAILELVVPAGTPALRLDDLAEIKEEREVLIIDARRYFVIAVRFDQQRRMWRIQAAVMEEEL